MYDFFAGIICIVLFAFVFTVDRTVKYYRQKKLFSLVAWSVIGDNDLGVGSHGRVNDMLLAIRQVQSSCAIPDQYKIVDGSDFTLVREIIVEFREYITNLYFRNQVALFKSKYAVSGMDFFIAMLYNFLSNNSTNSQFCGHDMFSERIAYKRYEGDGYSAKYTLSNFGILFYKLYYITFMYCKESPIFQSQIAGWAEIRIKNVLDSRQIEISYYRP